MPTFTWTAEFGSQKTKQPVVSQIKFGDGYEQRQTTGLNTNPQKWDLQFNNRDTSEIDDIDDFLDARGGVESFDWTPPRASDAIKVVCRQWQRTLASAQFDTLTATFEQVFEP